MGPVPEQVLPGTSTGPLNKVPFTLDGAGISGGATPRPPGQEDPDPSPQHVQGPGGLRPGQAGRVLKNLLFAGLPWAPLGPPGRPPCTPLGPPVGPPKPLGPPWAPLGPPGPPFPFWAPLGPFWGLWGGPPVPLRPALLPAPFCLPTPCGPLPSLTDLAFPLLRPWLPRLTLAWARGSSPSVEACFL